MFAVEMNVFINIFTFMTLLSIPKNLMLTILKLVVFNIEISVIPNSFIFLNLF